MTPMSLARRLAALFAACLLFALTAPATSNAEEIVYVANNGSDNLGALRIGAGGALSPLAGAPFAVVQDPLDIAVSPDRHRIFVSDQTGTIGVFDVRTDGTLAAVPGSPFTASDPVTLELSPDGRRLFVGGDPDVSVFDVAPNGVLSPVPGSPFAGDGRAVDIAITPDGRYLYTANWDDSSFSGFEVGPGGALTALAGSPFPLPGWGAGAIAVDPSGDQLYVGDVNTPYTAYLRAYDLGNGGIPTAQPGPPPVTDGAGEILIAPDDQHLYITTTGGVTTFAIAANGSLSGALTTPAGTTPGDLTLTPDGRHMYVANYGSGDVSAYAVAADGSLSGLAGAPFSSGGSSLFGIGVAVTPDPATPPPPAPETTIKGKPKYKQAEDTRFRFRSSIEGSTFKCRLDEAAFRGCKSPKNYKHLERGKHRFNVYAVSSDGVADPSPATVKFKVKAERRGKR